MQFQLRLNKTASQRAGKNPIPQRPPDASWRWDLRRGLLDLLPPVRPRSAMGTGLQPNLQAGSFLLAQKKR